MAPWSLVILFCACAAALAKDLKQSNEAKEELEKYIADKRSEINPRYRLHYHLAPPVGWMNDPNGFSFYKGEYHLFYQFYPYDSVWGPMHWGHSSSPDLINWKTLPTALLPEEEMCFSGSAVVDGDNLVLMYTGQEVTEEEPFFNQTQFLAFSDDGVDFTKFEGNPVIATAPNGNPDFRDPKVWKQGEHWYVVIGSKTNDDRGNVLLYRSLDLVDWEFLRVLGESSGSGELGFMWECPDFFELDGKYVLLLSPQGMEPVGDRYKNVHQTGVFIGDFNYDDFEFTQETKFQELDYGHDFYAAQTMEKDGKRYIVAWFNMWDVVHHEAVDGWAGAMTLIRELSLAGDRVLQKPLEGMVSLRQEKVFSGKFSRKQEIYLGQAAEINIISCLNRKIELLLEGQNGGGHVLLKWDPKVGKVVVDRAGDVRQVEWSPIGSHSWRLFLDASSLELFVGEGEVVFSSRVFPDGGWKITNLSQQPLKIDAYNLKRSVPL